MGGVGSTVARPESLCRSGLARRCGDSATAAAGTEPIGAISTLNPVPVPSGAIPPIGDGWGPGRINAPDIEVLNLSGEQSFAGYQGDITIDAVLLDYPDVFYLIDQPKRSGCLLACRWTTRRLMVPCG